MPSYSLLFAVFMLGMVLGALLTRIQLKGIVSRVREELEQAEARRKSEEKGDSEKSDAA